MCILTIQKNVDDSAWRFSTTNFQNELCYIPTSRNFEINFRYLTNQNNAIISPKIDNIPNIHPIKNTTALYKSLLLLAFLFIYYPFIVISLLFHCLVPQIPPNSPQYPEKFLLCIIHCCTFLFLTPLLIQWILFIHSIQ